MFQLKKIKKKTKTTIIQNGLSSQNAGLFSLSGKMLKDVFPSIET